MLFFPPVRHNPPKEVRQPFLIPSRWALVAYLYDIAIAVFSRLFLFIPSFSSRFFIFSPLALLFLIFIETELTRPLQRANRIVG